MDDAILKRKLLPDHPFSSNTPRIGTALLSGKIAHAGQHVNDQKYHYLGDPTMRVALPKGRAVVNEPNPRTLQALGKATLTGNLFDENGNKYSSGDISVAVNIFDSVDSVSHRETLNGVTGSVKYLLPGARIFTGPVSAVGDRFESTFIVPRDIKYGGNTGKGIVYWWDEKSGGVDGFQQSWQFVGFNEPVSAGFLEFLYSSGRIVSCPPPGHR